MVMGDRNGALDDASLPRRREAVRPDVIFEGIVKVHR